MHKGNERLKNVLAKEDVTSTYEHLAKLSAAAGSEEEFDKEATAERNSEQR
jgi:manganese transport protein